MNLREQAEEIFAWGLSQRHDHLAEGWKNHSFGAAKAASAIAAKSGLDSDLAYAMGLLHDIGRYDYHARMNHIYLGYEKMMAEGLPQVARICLTHSFPLQDSVKSLKLPDEGQTKFVQDFVTSTEYDDYDYDYLIQLVDHLSGVHGITLLERRFCSILYRHGLRDPRAEIIKLYDLKKYFDEKCGEDIYLLFKKEISEAPFRGIPGSYGHIENDGQIKNEEQSADKERLIGTARTSNKHQVKEGK